MDAYFENPQDWVSVSEQDSFELCSSIDNSVKIIH